MTICTIGQGRVFLRIKQGRKLYMTDLRPYLQSEREALRQIEEKNYEANLAAKEIPGKRICGSLFLYC